MEGLPLGLDPYPSRERRCSMLGRKARALGEPSQVTSKQSLGLCRVNTASEGRGSLGLVTTQNNSSRICCLKTEEREESSGGRETRLGRSGVGRVGEGGGGGRGGGESGEEGSGGGQGERARAAGSLQRGSTANSEQKGSHSSVSQILLVLNQFKAHREEPGEGQGG